MKISCNLLKKHIRNSEEIDWIKIWDTFTIRTAEVEGVEIKGDIKGVVVGEIIECVTHPKKEKYHILKVDNGEKIVDILCGAPNVRKGLKAPIVKVGGVVSGFTITPKEIAGVLSEGMLCSEAELGISDNHEGIMELPENLIVGRDICDYYPIKDVIVEIDNKSLTNRPDLWGHYGIAREIAAITKHELISIPLLELPKIGKKLDISVKDGKLCPRYMGLKIENVLKKTSPKEMQIMLYYTGNRAISLLVDLTNYIMIELGQPMHAFDARRVTSIEIGLAKEGDKFTTLDGIERLLSKDNLMIKKNNEYFAIAGVMGGLDSEILPDTTSVILESANFEPFSVRKTSIALGLRTEASARYEKSLDPNLTEIASKRFAYLLKEIDSEIIFASDLTDVYKEPLKEKKIKLSKKEIFKNIPENLTDSEIEHILLSLGFKVKTNKEDFDVTVPTYRATKDVSIEADLIEEIARMYGYENFRKIPLKLDIAFNDNKTIYKFNYKIKRYLATKYNMHEINTYLWNKTSLLNRLGIEKNNVRLLGKSEDNILRDDLTLSMIESATHNLKVYDKVKLFEIGTVIVNDENKLMLSYLIGDNINKIENVYYEVKEIMINIFKTFKNVNIDFIKESKENYYDENLSLKVMVNNEELGTINVLKNKYSSLLVKNKCFISGEIEVEKLFEMERKAILYKEISKYPTVTLDYTIITSKDIKYNEVNKVIKQFNGKNIISYSLIDRYCTDKESRYTIRYTLGSEEKTLDQKELELFKAKFIKHIENNKLEIVK